MKVILKEDLENLGQAGTVVEVKPGYGRNYLIPRGLAVIANASNVKRYEEETRQRGHKIEQQRKDAEALARRLGGMELTIPMPTGEENRLFGTVTTQQVADALAAKGIEVDRRKVALNEEIRVTGVYTATVRLHPEHTAEVKVVVVSDAPEHEEPAI
jgi:large subunit ribosomal protein L9